MDLPVQARSQGLDIVRGTAVILMVVYHMCEYAPTPTNASLMTICLALTAFRMPVLFLISGFLSAGIVNKPKRQALSRVTNLAWLYVLWLPVMLLASPEKLRADAVYILDNVWRPATELWFIWALMILIASLFIVVKIPRRTVLLASLLVATIDYSGIFGLTFGHDNLLRYAPMFYVGALCRAEVAGLIKAPFSLRSASVVVIGIAAIHVISELFRHSQGWQLFGPIERISVCAAAIYLLKPVEMMPAVANSLASVGQKTLPIYLLHLPLWMALKPVIPKLGGVATPLLSASLLVVACLLIHHAARHSRMKWLFGQPLWWSNGIAQAAWAMDRRYMAR